jgi:acetoin utilization protein AcuB
MSTRTVAQYMTRSPRTVAPQDTLAEAQRLMRDRRIRHLPVLEEGLLRGVLSQRDIYLMETLQGVDPLDVAVGEALRADVPTVSPGAALETVVARMWQEKHGAVVVVEERRLLGIFTRSDALRALVELLSERPSPGVSDDDFPEDLHAGVGLPAP